MKIAKLYANLSFHFDRKFATYYLCVREPVESQSKIIQNLSSDQKRLIDYAVIETKSSNNIKKIVQYVRTEQYLIINHNHTNQLHFIILMVLKEIKTNLIKLSTSNNPIKLTLFQGCPA